jgi:hypothetical protein
MRPIPHHDDGHIQDDQQPHIGDPAVAVQQPGDEVGGQAHQRDGEGEADDQHLQVVARRAGHGQHVVQRHRHIGQHDLGDGLAERLGRSALAVAAAGGRRAVLQRRGLGGVVGAQLAPQLPAHPQQQDAAGEQQADDLQQLGGEQGEDDAQHGGGDDAPQDGAAPLLGGQPGRGHADDDGVVAGQRHVDDHDLDEGGELGEREPVGHGGIRCRGNPERPRAGAGLTQDGGGGNPAHHARPAMTWLPPRVTA